MSSFANKLFNTPFFQNKFVLYASLFAVLFSIVRHISTGNMNAVVLMALIGLVTSYFSKNMIIILLTVFFTVFLLEMMGSKGVMEGMDNKNDDDDEDTDESKTKKRKTQRQRICRTTQLKKNQRKQKQNQNHAKKKNQAKTKKAIQHYTPKSNQ